MKTLSWRHAAALCSFSLIVGWTLGAMLPRAGVSASSEPPQSARDNRRFRVVPQLGPINAQQLEKALNRHGNEGFVPVAPSLIGDKGDYILKSRDSDVLILKR